MTILQALTKDNKKVFIRACDYFYYDLFDADDKNGESWPIQKDDIKKIIGEVDENGEIYFY